MKKLPSTGIVFTNLLLAFPLTVISYFYFLFDLGNYSKINEFLLQGKPFLIDYINTSPLLRYMPLFPAFIVWLFIGILVYFFYFSLMNVYFIIYNQLIIRDYEKADQKEDFSDRLRIAERLLVHAFVSVCFIIFIIFYYFILLPLSTKIITFVGNMLPTSNNTLIIVDWLPVLALLIYWIFFVGLVQIAWHYLKKLDDFETFKNKYVPL